jgi:tRNA U34 5-methylaminomethyl-2-thiouridine-forming methyltransferase MnmC
MVSTHPDFEIIYTADGSPTVRSGLFGETYHSLHGAVQESRHVFLDHGLAWWLSRRPSKGLKILEMGFGTGLNFLLTKRFWEGIAIDLDYYAIEKFPIGSAHAQKIDYSFSSVEERASFLSLHDLSAPTLFTKEEGVLKFHPQWMDFEEFKPQVLFDVVYFDVFAPTCQPVLWESSFLSKMKSWMQKEAVLVTYGAKGSFKRALKELGFIVENPPGPKGKREMTRAILQPL